VTSMEALLARPVEVDRVAHHIALEFGAVFARGIEWLPGQSLIEAFEEVEPGPAYDKLKPAALQGI